MVESESGEVLGRYDRWILTIESSKDVVLQILSWQGMTDEGQC